MPTSALSAEEIRRDVDSARWYHTIELPHGVVTEGEYDLRPLLERLPFPASLTGQRCLDVGTRDGFWAFEMEKRGATEVVGIDLDDPWQLDWPQPVPTLPPEVQADLDARARCFGVAARARSSNVERRNRSVYDLDPEVDGTFDFAFFGTLLLHLRDPVGALMAVRRVVDGTLLLNDVISVSRTFLGRGPSAALMSRGAPFWWLPSADGVKRYAEAAGWRVTNAGKPYLVKNGRRPELPPLQIRNPRPFVQAAILRAGAPHVWLELESS